MQRSLVIDGIEISDASDCYVIAEIGHNHQGEVEKCKELFRVAKECGVNAVKLQKRDNRTLFTRAMYDKPYDHRNSFGKTYGEHREALEFGWHEYSELKIYAAELGITLFATAFDIPSADFLAELDMPAIKIASADLKNTPLLRHVAHFQKPILLSTGGGEMEDIQRACDAILPINRQLGLLQCTATYPTPAEEMNLNVITTLRTEFPELVIGLSDHYDGIAMAVVAYVLGARIIEKHFTLHHTWKGSDHAMSLEPIGMSKMVRDLHRACIARGDGVKRVLDREREPLFKMAKSLVAARNLPVGHILRPNDIAIKIPAGGLPPYEFDNLVGRRTTRAFQEDDPFILDALEAVSS